MSISPGSAGIRTRLTRQVVAEARRDIAAGAATINDYASDLQVSWRTIESAVYGYTWRSVTDPPALTPPPPPPASRPRPSFARLNARLVAEMRTAYRAGSTTIGELARQSGVHENTVRSAIHGYTWRSVPEPPVPAADVGGWTILSEADEHEILERRGRNQPYRTIGAALGLDPTVVFRAYKRLTGAA